MCFASNAFFPGIEMHFLCVFQHISNKFTNIECVMATPEKKSMKIQGIISETNIL